MTAFVLACHSLVFAQFNTLTRNEMKTNENFSEKQNFQNEQVIKKEINEKSFINKFFNSPKKVDLKKEIDSLKIMMRRYSLSSLEEKEESYTNNDDSPVKMGDDKLSNQRNASIEKSIKKFDFIDEEELISKISMPLDRKIVVTSHFGRRIHPIFRTAKMHTGTDFKANYENVYAVLDGIVTAAGWDPGGGGNYIKVRHSSTFETSYLHLSETYYRTGEFVKAGFIIAKSGNTGNSTGAHLHFSVTENGRYINPIRFLNDLIKANNLIANYYEAGRNSNTQY